MGSSDRVEKTLMVWKVKDLSFGGRITLINSTLSNLPVYFMLLFWCPMLDVNQLEKPKRDFSVAREGG